MEKHNFHRYLINLGFSESEVLGTENIFSYSPHPQIPSIKYILVHSDNDIFLEHKRLWNQNSDNVFLAVASEKTYLINAKAKPDSVNPLKKEICIDSFDYGINSKGYEGVDIEKISKNSISSTYFFQYIQEKQGRNKHEVDKDLLLNLIALRNDLINGGNEHIVHLLILRCLFVKYLEDRGIFEENFLSNTLGSNNPNKLIDAFNEVCKINGDVFGNTTIPEQDIKPEYLKKLHTFFTTDYRSKQGTLFPYRFDYIPIQLISHVYEAFLKNETKKDKGIYYTPHFVVDFMLSQSLKCKAQENTHIRVLDVAVGSGPFLVESFKIIRDAYKRKLNLDEKRQILENQLFGIDNDNDALQITAFSLYLALLEDEDSKLIKEKIEKAHPILPSLIGKTLIKANTLVDSAFEGEKFDFIASNPPWGSVPSELNKENIAEREAIDNKNGAYPEYQYVADYERSQAFLRRVSRWQKEDTITAMIVKNSIFLNDQAPEFRKSFLKNNKVDIFFELSHYNKILFKKKPIGRVNGKIIEIGASEPCVVVIFRPNFNNEDYTIKYISPKLTRFGEHFELIHYTSNDSFDINRQEFIDNDSLWKVLVNSDIDGTLLIQKIKNNGNINSVIRCDRGFEAFDESKMKQIGEKCFLPLITPNFFNEYYKKGVNGLPKFLWNRKIRRLPIASSFSKDYFEENVIKSLKNKNDLELVSKYYKLRKNKYFLSQINNPNIRLGIEEILSGVHNSIYSGDRILIDRTPSNAKRLDAVIIDSSKIIFKDGIICFKVENLKDYRDYYAIIISKLTSFYLNNSSSQIGKGKRNSLRVKEGLENFPFAIFNESFKEKLKKLTDDKIERIKNNQDYSNIELLIDELVFENYNLSDYEKEIIKEFYQVNVDRAGKKLQLVQPKDMHEYFTTFKESFSLFLSPAYVLNATYNSSTNIGAIIKISIVEKAKEKELQTDDTMQVMQFVKSKQLTETDKLFREEKVKIYEPKHFYIIKSNLFKDWTRRQAMNDAKEEIGLLLSKLPETNG
jgi:hypothetical protein